MEESMDTIEKKIRDLGTVKKRTGRAGSGSRGADARKVSRGCHFVSMSAQRG